MAESEKSRGANAAVHSVTLVGRETLSVSGTTDVISFDESCIVLSTVCGVISVDGSDMHINSLDTEKGNVDISGSINGIIYPEGMQRGGGLFRRKSR